MSVKLKKNSIKVGRKEIKDLLPSFFSDIQDDIEGFISDSGVQEQQRYGNVEVYLYRHTVQAKHHRIQFSLKVEQSEFT